ncbi:hypothetical protein [Algoriphagus sp. NBT04N3]|nr:hypothetical protein [Algoriphagus sp. NBT04N3]
MSATLHQRAALLAMEAKTS